MGWTVGRAVIQEAASGRSDPETNQEELVRERPWIASVDREGGQRTRLFVEFPGFGSLNALSGRFLA